jgi:hypothetical protein
MLVVGQGQTLYYIPPEQFDPMRLQVVVGPQTPQIQLQQPKLGELIVDVLGKLMVVGFGCAIAYAGCEMLFGTEKRVMHCSGCGSANHTVRNCPFTGQRTRLAIEKTGMCGCCGGRFRSTQLHHFAGRGEERGKEMCGPCHFHCGHGGDWLNFPINPRYCRLDA